MAPKPHNLPSPTDSSDSETDSQEHFSTTSSGDSDSDSQPQQLTQPTPQQAHQEVSSESESDSDSQPKQLTQPAPRQAHEEDSSESESESYSEDDSDQTQKPLSPEPKKPVSKPTESKAKGKRPAEIDQMVGKSKKSKGVEKVEKGSKSVDRKGLKNVEKGGGKGLKSVEKVVDKGSNKGKVSNGEQEGGEIENKKANLFARLFTENDEIVLLEGMIDFKEKNNGGDPSLNIVAFHDSVEDLLSCRVSKSQMADKIRRLKKKYINHLKKKGKKKGKGDEDPVISRPHEFKSFELSKKIWGSEGLGSQVNGDSKVKGSSRKKDKKDDNASSKMPLKSVGKEIELKEDVESEVETEDWWSLYPVLCASLEAEAIKNFSGPMSPEEYVNKVVSGLNKDKARELEQELMDCIVMEHQVYAKKLKVKSDQAEAAMNVIQH